jgi:NAD+ kinase
MTRSVLLVTHAGRAEALEAGREVAGILHAAGIRVLAPGNEAAELGIDTVERADDADPVDGAELVLVLGGDGTLLRAAALAYNSDVPILGVNLGHVGFLAEMERDDLARTVSCVVDRSYEVEDRLTLDVQVLQGGELIWSSWALNEASVEKASRERMIDLVAEIDGRPLSRWGCDGVVCATPTGSTAYAFSAGGPVVWPSVEALLMVPISAHALFARPLVVAPTSVLAVELPAQEAAGVVWCDGRRMVEIGSGARVEVRRGRRPLRLARLTAAPFTNRLVDKFDLPVNGWRGTSAASGTNAPIPRGPAGPGTST